jgi:single-stranded-DNA-specific exonuclease
MSACRWILPPTPDSALVDALQRDLGIAQFAAELLIQRGFADTAKAAAFLTPKLKTLGDPFALPGMAAAVERILAAIDRREPIVLYGDYDVDGVTSLALLTLVLRAFGGTPECFLPSRIDEGYGLSADGVTRCLSEHTPALLIAVDCGTSSAAEIETLCARGVDVIVLDHHECKETLPKCVALVNPKLGDSHQYLCSVGLVFKVAHALLKRRPLPDFDLREYLDLVALGTVADLVPLQDENRLLVRHGLQQLASSRRVGVRSLIEVARLRPPFMACHVGFGLGPRLNAAGRLGTARAALELLLTEDPVRARELAVALDAQNRDRRAVEDDVLRQAEAQLAETFDPERDAAIVVGASGWHPGVVGIVASRLQKRHHRPTLVIGFDEAGIGKGSGRSIEGLSLVDALSRCDGLLEKHGGHAMAAGITIRQECFEAFRRAFGACAREMLGAEQLQPRLRLDAELSLQYVNYALLEQHEALQPFGMMNPQPVFFTRRISPAAEPRVIKEKHLSVILRQGYHERRAMWFNAAETELPPPPWDVAFTVERNEYQGVISVDLHLKAVRASAD